MLQIGVVGEQRRSVLTRPVGEGAREAGGGEDQVGHVAAQAEAKGDPRRLASWPPDVEPTGGVADRVREHALPRVVGLAEGGVVAEFGGGYRVGGEQHGGQPRRFGARDDALVELLYDVRHIGHVEPVVEHLGRRDLVGERRLDELARRPAHGWSLPSPRSATASSQPPVCQSTIGPVARRARSPTTARARAP